MDPVLCKLVLELIALTGVDQAEPEVDKIKEWTAKLVLDKIRHLSSAVDVD